MKAVACWYRFKAQVNQVESGSYHANQRVRFLPDLRPLIVAGIVEGRVNFKTFDPKNLSQVDSRDGFEEELYEIADADNHKQSAHGRVALFLKGKVKGEYLLTLSYDSDKSKDQRLFRDIRPDEYYPVYGDAAAKGFDAQSTSKLYVRMPYTAIMPHALSKMKVSHWVNTIAR